MQWKGELLRYTDFSPVFNADPPMTVTKPKEFAFKCLSKGRNSPNKEMPPAIVKGIFI